MNIPALFQETSEAATVLGIFAVAYQIRDDKKKRREEDRRMRRQATLDYARQTLDARHKDWGDLPDDYDKHKIEDFIRQCIHEGQPGQKLESALGYLNFMETLCIGADVRIYDDDTVFELYGERIIKVNEHYSPLIRWRKITTRNDNVYVGLQEGADRYIKLKEKNNKKPFLVKLWREWKHPRSRTPSQHDDARAADWHG